MQVYHNSPHLHPKLLYKQECGLHPPISNCCWSPSQMIWALCFISMLSLSSTTDKGVPAHQQLHLMLEISFMHTHTWLYDKRLVKQLLPQCRLATIVSIKFSVKRTTNKSCSCLACLAQTLWSEKNGEKRYLICLGAHLWGSRAGDELSDLWRRCMCRGIVGLGTGCN